MHHCWCHFYRVDVSIAFAYMTYKKGDNVTWAPERCRDQ